VQCLGEMPWEGRATAIKPDARYMSRAGVKVKADRTRSGRLVLVQSFSATDLQLTLAQLAPRREKQLVRVFLLECPPRKRGNIIGLFRG
jgi:hypothetical protein